MQISYITSHGTAEWINFNSDDGEVLRLALDKALAGALTLGGRAFTLSGGVAEIPTKAIPDGEHTPIFETNEGVFVGERFYKSGRTVSPRGADEMLIRRLLTRCASLENGYEALKKRVSDLEKTCTGHGIFNFDTERKKI